MACARVLFAHAAVSTQRTAGWQRAQRFPRMAQLQEGINRHVFGEGLNPLEQEWLAEVVNEHLGESGTPGLQRVCATALSWYTCMWYASAALCLQSV